MEDDSSSSSLVRDTVTLEREFDDDSLDCRREKSDDPPGEYACVRTPLAIHTRRNLIVIIACILAMLLLPNRRGRRRDTLTLRA